MLNDFSSRTKIIRAALELAQVKRWRDLTFTEIARQAGVSLVDARNLFDHKGAILSAFQREVDKAALAKVTTGNGQEPRDKLLDLLMTRFEVMAPYRAALRRIVRDIACHPSEAGHLVGTGLISQYWMLTGAGVPLFGAVGGLTVGGLAAIYGQAFRRWLDDDSPGFENTMAFLDRKLARGQRVLARVKEARAKMAHLVCCAGACCKGKHREASHEAPKEERPTGESVPEPRGAGY